MFNHISLLFILCINTGNFYSVFSSLQDVITCTYMTCKNKVYKTPVHRLSSSYNDIFNSVHPKIQQQGLREALESRHWTEDMINTFISNFREKHGFNKHTAMLPYRDENDSEDEPIHLEGGSTVVVRRRIISPRDSSTQEENRLDDLVSKPKKRPADPTTGESEPGAAPAKKPKKDPKKPKKAAKPKTPAKPKKDPKKPKKKKAKKGGESSSTPVPPLGEPGLNPRRYSRGRTKAKHRSFTSTNRRLTSAASRGRSNATGG